MLARARRRKSGDQTSLTFTRQATVIHSLILGCCGLGAVATWWNCRTSQRRQVSPVSAARVQSPGRQAQAVEPALPPLPRSAPVPVPGKVPAFVPIRAGGGGRHRLCRAVRRRRRSIITGLAVTAAALATAAPRGAGAGGAPGNTEPARVTAPDLPAGEFAAKLGAHPWCGGFSRRNRSMSSSPPLLGASPQPQPLRGSWSSAGSSSGPRRSSGSPNTNSSRP